MVPVRGPGGGAGPAGVTPATRPPVSGAPVRDGAGPDPLTGHKPADSIEMSG